MRIKKDKITWLEIKNMNKAMTSIINDRIQESYLM